MFTNVTKQFIRKEFDKIAPFLKEYRADVLSQLSSLDEEQQTAMMFLYASMPVSDMADYDFGVYMDFVEHALFLRKNVSWCKDIPDDIFLSYVLYHRINNEDIHKCRKLFYQSIYERVAGRTMEEAALEVNYWCAENVTYRSTDIRTASPLAVWRAGSGRCGEESTFTVTALRSVGLPARQIYAPRWSHCDDNHAWVEVWCDGKWHYMGACEPEPVLDRGWFTEPATRAMFIHNRTFSPIITGEKTMSTKGKTYVINRTKDYALTRPFKVRIVDEQEKPVAGAVVRFEVLNQSEFYPVVSDATDEKGEVEMVLGLGDMHLHVIMDGQFVECLVDTAHSDSITIIFNPEEGNKAGARDFAVRAPKADKGYNVQLTKEQMEEKNRRTAYADKIREERISAFYREQEAEAIVEKYPFKEELKDALRKARGNFDEVVKYLSAPVNGDNPHLRTKLLISLSEKDFYDLKSEVLLEHYQRSLQFAGEYDDELLVKYVMCPRIYFEKLTPYRGFIAGYFGEKTLSDFRNNPELVWDFVSKQIATKEDQEYDELYTSPEGLLQVKQGSEMSKKILFTAICRTAGVPARLNPVTLFAEYLQAGRFVPVGENADMASKLVVRSSGKTQWNYMQNWTLAMLEKGSYRTLDFSAIPWKDGCLTVEIPEGSYRLIVSNRAPNGNLSAREYFFTAERNKTAEVWIELPDAGITELIENIEIPDFRLINRDGTSRTLKELAGDMPVVAMWLEEGKEPTEHILNELMECYNEFNASDSRMIFILRDESALSNATLRKVLNTGLNVDVYYGDFAADAPEVAKSLNSESDKFPLVFVTTDGRHSAYSFSGYNVGMAELLLKILNAIR